MSKGICRNILEWESLELVFVFDMVENVKPFCRICESEKLEVEEEYLSNSFKRENEFGNSRHK